MKKLNKFYETLKEAVKETGCLTGDKNSEWLTIHIDNPAGEDYFIDVVNKDYDNLVNTIECTYNNFDIDDYVETWLEAKRNGVDGVPGAKALVENAEYIEEALFKLLMNIQEYFS